MHDVLAGLSRNINVDGKKNIVNVDRADVLDGGMRAFSRATFNPKHLLSVRFAAEDGIDTGGLTREFLRLAVSALKNSHLFTGPPNARHIAMDYKGLIVLVPIVVLTKISCAWLNAHISVRNILHCCKEIRNIIRIFKPTVICTLKLSITRCFQRQAGK